MEKKLFLFALCCVFLLSSCMRDYQCDGLEKRDEKVIPDDKKDDKKKDEGKKDEDTKPKEILIFSPNKIKLDKKESLSTSVKALDSSEIGKLVYSSDSDAIVSIDENGVVTANARGITHINVKTEDGKLYGRAIVYVSDDVPSSALQDGRLLYWPVDATPTDSVLILPKSVKDINFRSFINNEKIKKVIFPDSIKSIGSTAFSGCKSLTEVEIPDGVQLGWGVFDKCDSLKSVIMGKGVKFDEYIGQCFKDCKNLKHVTLPSDLEVLRDNTFYNCSSIDTLRLPSSLKEICPGAFANLSSLKSIELEDGNEYFVLKDGVLFNKGGDKLILYPAYKKGEDYKVENGVKEIADFAFANSHYLINLTLPESIKKMGRSSFYSFKGVGSINNITCLMPFEDIVGHPMYYDQTLYVPEANYDAYKKGRRWSLCIAIKIIK